MGATHAIEAGGRLKTATATRRSRQDDRGLGRSGAAAFFVAATSIRTTTNAPLALFAFISLNRQAARSQLDVHAFRLMAVLIELIAQHGDGDRKRADHKIKHVGAGHGG